MKPNRPIPKRLSVIRHLQQLLAQINTIDGDAFDIGIDRVLRNTIIIGSDKKPDPALLSIVEAPRPDFAMFAGEDNKQRKDNWTLLIQGMVMNGYTADTEDDAYFLCQDVERRLLRISENKKSGTPAYPDDHLLGGKITSVEVAPPVIRPPEAQVSSYAFFYLPIRLGIAVKIGE